MASRHHGRRAGADRFWPGPETRAGTGDDDPQTRAGTGDDDSAKAPASAAEPGPPRDPEAAARQICLRLLTIEPRTRSQLAQAMQRRQVPDAVAEGILDRFTEAGLIDDQAFARAWVDSRHHSRGLSRRALSTELRRRGVDANDVRDAVETLDPEQEAATARQIVDRKLRSTRGQPLDTRVRRLMGALARRGYGPALAYRIVREALEAEGTELAGALDDPDPDIALEDGQHDA